MTSLMRVRHRRPTPPWLIAAAAAGGAPAVTGAVAGQGAGVGARTYAEVRV